MRRATLALVLLAALPAAAQTPSAPSPAQRQAQQAVESDQRRDRVADAARDLERGGPGGPSGVVDDMNRQRPGLTPERLSDPSVTSRTTPESAVPLLSDNVQR